MTELTLAKANAIIATALFRARPNRILHAVDDSALKMGDYFDLVADALKLPKPPRLPRTQLAATLSPMAGVGASDRSIMPAGTLTRVISSTWSKLPPNFFQRVVVIHTARTIPIKMHNA